MVRLAEMRFYAEYTMRLTKEILEELRLVCSAPKPVGLVSFSISAVRNEEKQ